ncbi:cadherin repeat domain-containing protein [Aureibaculum sp. A20]|uniref:Cadherin repeat domain-containing protein n=1 Tax=Aureibaculum flavum TaxID=2795986 RepID=A0ABS0WR44_9FLAO|nr:cadherin repeat domain-containing protein [Aureibaculum flavum]MBJ2174427.1 cadherin repeat domain-containing protein [Aureibaculum flavum]
MKKLKVGVLLTVFSLTIMSCSSDDPDSLTTANITKSIDENAADGTIVATVSGTSNAGAVSFSILNQTPAGAMTINATTGELTVADATIFDFETNPQITAEVQVATESLIENSSVIINLNNIDDIEFLLSTSKTNYKNGSDGNWVAITAAEYNNLEDKLNEVSRAGASEAEFNSSVTSEEGGSSSFTVSKNNSSQMITKSVSHSKTSATTIPNAGYLIAFKYEVNPYGGAITDAKVKQSSTSNYSGFADLGGSLPSHTSTAAETFYFVLKGNTTATTAVGHMAFYKSSSNTTIFKRISGTSYYYSSHDSNTLGSSAFNGSSSGVVWLQQGLCTTQKQW